MACLFGSALSAETIGDVDFQFPPSPYNWVLLTDTSTYPPLEGGEKIPLHIKMYTHKVGDVLEFFSATTLFDEEAEEEESEETEQFHTSEFAQLFINDLLGNYFPNHRISITNISEEKDAGFLEWEIDDGVQLIFHGVCRYMRVNQKDYILNYTTMGSKTPQNIALWIDTLNQAKAID